MTSALDIRRRRALYRANHRGTKEMDWLLGRYAEARLGELEGEPLARFERLLEISDVELQSWILAPSLVGESEFRALVVDIAAFHGLAEPA